MLAETINISTVAHEIISQMTVQDRVAFDPDNAEGIGSYLVDEWADIDFDALIEEVESQIADSIEIRAEITDVGEDSAVPDNAGASLQP
jgi:hypothetical protein